MPLSVKKAVCGNEVKVAKAPLVACLTCPLCGQLFQEATTICECLHTFCRECIHNRLSDGETNGCPMCNVNLGCLPLEKLRADHQLDDVKAKLFPNNVRKRKLGAVVSPVVHNVGKRKERSLYSLGIGSVPSVSNPGFASRKTKWSPSTTADGNESTSSERTSGGHDEGREKDEPFHERDEEDEVGDEGDDEERGRSRKTRAGEEAELEARDVAGGGKGEQGGGARPSWNAQPSDAPATASPSNSAAAYLVRALAPARNGRKADQSGSVASEQVRLLSAAEPLHARGNTSTETSSLKEEDGAGVGGGAAGLGDNSVSPSCPLATLAEVAGADAARSTPCPGAKLSGSVSPVAPAMEASPESESGESPMEHETEPKLKGVGAGSRSGSAGSAAHRSGANVPRISTARICQDEAFKKSEVVKSSSPGLTGHCAVPCRRKMGGVWFALEAAENQLGESVLPQIASPYLRIRDGRLPVSLVKKYLVKKLGLKSETEVEITCRGQPVVPSLPLESVRNIWFATAGSSSDAKSKDQDPTPGREVGSPNDYLMVLTYQKHRRRIC